MAHLEPLLDHLSAEQRCLEAIVETLDLQASALRTIDLSGLERCTSTLTQLARQHTLLATERPALLEQVAGTPIARLSELSDLLSPEDALQVAEVRACLARTVAELVQAKSRNREWAATGSGLIDGAIRVARRRLTPPTYGVHGRIKNGPQRSRLNGVG